MHDILLILPIIGPPQYYEHPRNTYDFESYKWILRLTRVPQGLLSIATMLEQKNFSVKIFDCRLHLICSAERLEKDLRREIRATKLCVGISVLTFQIGMALQISEMVKQENPNLLVVFGGYHPTLYPEQTVADPLVDMVVVGEGEYPLMSLAEVLELDGDLSSVDSLVWKRKGKIKQNTLAKPFNINELPTPSYDLLEIENYLTKRSYNPDKDVRGIEYNGLRGCCYDCAFCINRVLPQQHVWRGKKADRVVEDLTILKDKYKLEYVFFEEELPFIDRKRSLELAKKIKPLGLRWYANIRVDMVYRDHELLRALREAGWCETSIGAESGSDRILQMLRKGIRAEQTVKVAEILNELDVYCLYSFMTDLPTETLDDKNATFKLMRKLKRIHPKNEFIGPQTYRPYPRTEFYEQLKSEGKFQEPNSLREWIASGVAEQFGF